MIVKNQIYDTQKVIENAEIKLKALHALEEFENMGGMVAINSARGKIEIFHLCSVLRVDSTGNSYAYVKAHEAYVRKTWSDVLSHIESINSMIKRGEATLDRPGWIPPAGAEWKALRAEGGVKAGINHEG